jgi:hypothetical protein
MWVQVLYHANDGDDRDGDDPKYSGWSWSNALCLLATDRDHDHDHDRGYGQLKNKQICVQLNTMCTKYTSTFVFIYSF